jgi:hypothetical protein
VTAIAQRLRAVTEETLEQVAFAPAFSTEAPFDWGSDELVWASIRLRNALTGELVCAAPLPTLRALAQDAWGADTGAEGAEAFLAEALNIIGGRLLATLYPDVPPDLGLPETGLGARLPPSGALALAFEVDAGAIGLALQFDGEAAEPAGGAA